MDGLNVFGFLCDNNLLTTENILHNLSFLSSKAHVTQKQKSRFIAQGFLIIFNYIYLCIYYPHCIAFLRAYLGCPIETCA